MQRLGVLLAGAALAACGAHAPQASVAPSTAPAPTSSGSRTVSLTDERPTLRGVAISGGTLAVVGRLAVASDPDRDRIWVVDLDAMATRAEIETRPGDEPGRVAGDSRGLAHVVLRRGGAILTIDPAIGGVLLRRPVCAA